MPRPPANLDGLVVGQLTAIGTSRLRSTNVTKRYGARNIFRVIEQWVLTDPHSSLILCSSSQIRRGVSVDDCV